MGTRILLCCGCFKNAPPQCLQAPELLATAEKNADRIATRLLTISRSRQLDYKRVPHGGVFWHIMVKQCPNAAPYQVAMKRIDTMNKTIAIASALTLLLGVGCASTSEPPPSTTQDGM